MKDSQDISWDDARDRAAHISNKLQSECISISHGLGRTLANDSLALCDLPTYTTSSMDGWAVSGPGPWQIVGDVKAGQPQTEVLLSGTTVRIATGAVIPAGTFGVLRWENAEVMDDYVNGKVTQDSDIRPAGEECKKGDTLLKSGTVLSPAHIGLLAASGYDEIEVVRRPRIALLLLGDELQLNGIPQNGKVRDSLGVQIPGWLERLGADVISFQYVSDELETVISALQSVIASCDLIITTGGTANGPRDHVHSALESLNASLVVDRVRSRPGHPMLLALVPYRGNDQVPLVGLPGNPQSAIMGLMTLGAPVISSLLGQEIAELRTVPTANELSAPVDFTRLVLGNLVGAHFEIGEHLGSAMLRGLAFSTGVAVTRSGITPIGGEVRWLPLP